MVTIGSVVDAIVARVLASQKEPAAASRRSKVREETSLAAGPRAASEPPDKPAMGERGMSDRHRADAAPVGDQSGNTSSPA